jgi:putative membrane protein
MHGGQDRYDAGRLSNDLADGSAAEEAGKESPMVLNLEALVTAALGATIFTLLGLFFFGVFFALIQKLTPFSIRKEIEEDQNTALGIVLASVILGIAMIVSAAIHG